MAVCRQLLTEHFYPRPPRGGRREDGDVAHHTVVISIHALREEGDKLRSATLSSLSVFLSTPSARRATVFDVSVFFGIVISIHALREEGDNVSWYKPLQRFNFYPRPPRGGRLAKNKLTPEECQFLSTPSARRATRSELQELTPKIFLSTPSARRATNAVFTPYRPYSNFYPRPPRGGRL